MEQSAGGAAFEISVAPDRMRAWLCLVDGGDVSNADVSAVTTVLKSANIVINEKVQGRIEAFLAQLADEDPNPAEFLVAEGRPAVDGENGAFEWAPPPDDSLADRDDDRIDPHSLTPLHILTEGEIIGRIMPSSEGTSGVDVHGKSVAPSRRGQPVKVGENVRLLDDGDVAATTPGKAIFDHGTVRLDAVLEINGDVDYESGNIDAPCNVLIHGSVLDQFVVKSKKSITIDKNVRAAEVEAGEHVLVSGGIVGCEKGLVSAGGSISVKFCEEATLRAGADIRLGTSSVNCELRAEGMVIGESAKIVGGNVYGRGGVVIGTLGNEAGVPTHVAVGLLADDSAESGREGPISEDFIVRRLKERSRKQADSLARLEDAVRRIRQSAQPVLDNRDRLPKAHVEKAAYLLEEAERIEREAERLRRVRDRSSEDGAPLGTADILINHQAFPKVVLTIDDRLSRVNGPLRGPARIEKRKVDNVTEVVVINQITGSLSLLNSRRLKLTTKTANAAR